MKRKLAALLLLATLFAACGGGRSEDDKLREALGAITDDQLAVMVLTQDQFGSESAGFEIDPDNSGFQDNDTAAEDTVDPDDTTETIEEAGRVNGYELSFDEPGLESLERGSGLFNAASTIDLFSDDSSAAAFLSKQAADYDRFSGQELDGGITLTSTERFDVSGLADEALGFDLGAAFGDREFFGTLVGFRVGRVVGATSLASADQADLRSRAEELARALEERIRAVLLGEIQETPVPIPTPEEDEVSSEAPDAPPFPEEMALSLEDLPGGVSIAREGYVVDEDTFSTYEREFDLGSASIGNSQLVGLESIVDLYQDENEASTTFAGFEAIFSGESAAEFFASSFGESAGFEPRNVQRELVALPVLGDDTFGVSFKYDSPVGAFENVFLRVRHGRAIGGLVVTAIGGAVIIEDMVPLLQAMSDRMQAELAASP